MKIDEDSFQRDCQEAWDKYPNEMGCLTSLRELLDEDLRGAKRYLLEEEHLRQRADGTYELAHDFHHSPVGLHIRIVDAGADQGVTNIAIFDPRPLSAELVNERNQAPAQPQEIVQDRNDCQGEQPFSAYLPFAWWMGDNRIPCGRSLLPEGAVVLPRDPGYYEYQRELLLHRYGCRRREFSTSSPRGVPVAPARAKAPCR